MNDLHQRLQNEQNHLLGKIEKLRAFIWDGNDDYQALCQQDQYLLMTQLHVMRQYSDILRRRIERVVFD